MRCTYRQLGAQLGRLAVGAGVAAVLHSFVALPAWGQGTQEEVTLISTAGNGPDFDTRELRRRGFQLFATGDGAQSGMRGTGAFGSFVTNYGDCGTIFRNCQNSAYRLTRGGTTSPWFHLDWVAGAPPHEWLKIRQVAPSVNKALGRGWTAGFNGETVGRPVRFGPRDGTLGTLFAGVTATADGSCRDHTGFGNGNRTGGSAVGNPILAGSDCTATWGSQGWPGTHPIDGEGWKELFDDLGPNFNFDFWRVPVSYQRLDKPFLGGAYTAVGESSDLWLEQKAAFGEVLPGGTGPARISGYPLGLVINVQHFNFAVQTVASGRFAQVLLINRSEDVWGVGIDYDSLYFGMSHGTLQSAQSVSEYVVPGKGMILFHNSNAKGAGGPCSDPARGPAGVPGCNGTTALNRGYGEGATGVIWLKTPLGDLRNKLFTRTPSGAACTPNTGFCNPSHPQAGDTITFNQHKIGGFGGGDAITWGYSARSGFGLLSSTEENTLDGRAITAISDNGAFQAFRNIGWPAIRGVYNKYVPGVGAGPGSVWDWNKDGLPDTIYSASCGPAGCAAISSDTLPGGHRNAFGNIGGLSGIGPFKLAAGDTVGFVYAVVADGDSAKFWSQANAMIDLYLNFYLAPEPPPPFEIVSTVIRPGTDEFGTRDPQVQLLFSEAPETWVDPYLLKVAGDVESSAPGTLYNTLLTLNPTLPAMLRTRAADNLAALEIYKSCDGGNNFTADGDCDGDPAIKADGTTDGFGWRAYSRVVVDATGNVANSFTDGNVDGARTYLYTIVAQTRGAVFLLNTATGPDSVVFAPSIRNVLSRSTSDPNVASIFVPASRPAGYRVATASFSVQQNATTPFAITLTDNAVPGAYRAVFGNRIAVRRDSSISAVQPLQTVVTIERRERVNNVNDSLIASETFTFAGGDVFQVEGTPGAPSVTTSGDTVKTLRRYSGLGFVLASPSSPIFGSITLTGSAATPVGILTQPTYPGFTVSANNSLAGTFHTETEAQVRGAQSIAELKLEPSDTIVPRGIVNAYMVQWLEATAIRTEATGLYEVTWTSDPFGVERGFVPNYSNPTATEAEVRASLEARPVAYTGLTDIETSGYVGVAQELLVPVKVPFTIRNVTFDRSVDMAMARRLSNRILLGSGVDTLSVEVQADQWVPGDALYVIENIVEDSTTATGLVLDAGGQPVQRTRRVATFTRAVLGCNAPRASCNPIVQGVAGATGYDPMNDGDLTRFEYYAGFRPTGEYAFDVTGAVFGDAITAVTDSALALVRVVPNPYVVYSAYQSTFTDSRLLFTNLPSRGVLRIYTVAGQFVQQITWEGDDLEGDGDLFWDLKTREGIDIASGLYIWVLTAPSDPSNAASATLQARGKFVVIRGDSR